MDNFNIIKYIPPYYNKWNNFVANSKNATFLFHRDFMDYHQDRFNDNSLLIFKNEKLVAVLPANKKEDTLYSHQGLSYGGLIFQKNINFKDAFQSFKELLKFCKVGGIKSINLKLLPKIYHEYPSDEMDYFLFLIHSELIRRDVSSTIDNSSKIKIQSNRIEGKRKAERQGLIVKEEANFNGFWNEILIPNLQDRHQSKPVHSLKEIELLQSNFPKNIRQFNVYKDSKIVAGTTIFETKKVAHVQYISANFDKQKLGSLDFLFEHLINSVFKEKKYFDFGISNENNGYNINEGLLFWKEGFGARSIVHDFYKIDTKNYNLLDGVLK